MPDPKRRTISASQVGALFGVSRFSTRWMLWRSFVHGAPWTTEETSRTSAGRYFEPGILQWASDVEKFEITRHPQSIYQRHPNPDVPLGCTRDASIVHPSWGPGIVEAKLIGYFVWRERWDSGEAHDPDVMLQLQTQLACYPECKWGMVAIYVEGHGLETIHIQRDPYMIEDIIEEARAFLASVERLEEPQIEGHEMEAEMVGRLFPATTESKVVYTNDPKVDEMCEQYLFSKPERALQDKLAKRAKTYLLGVAKDAAILQSKFHQTFINRSKGRTRINIKPQERF